MTECPSPHSSAQTIGNSPRRSGVTVYLTSMPGTASFFMRKAGTQKSCSTSLDCSVKRTWRSIGRYSWRDATSSPSRS